MEWEINNLKWSKRHALVILVNGRKYIHDKQNTAWENVWGNYAKKQRKNTEQSK